MTRFKRRILSAIFILLFLILAPIIAFYANGNILGGGLNILATGGIFLKSMESGSELYLNNKLKDTTSYFTRDYFLKNLRPGTYDVLVKKPGYNDWTNVIKVYANRVSESNVFVLPEKISIQEIKPTIEIQKIVGTTTVKSLKPNPNYITVKSFFDETFTTKSSLLVVSTTTGLTTKYLLGTKENPIKSRHFYVWSENNDVFIGWDGGINSSPKMFCEETKDNIKCSANLKVYSFSSAVQTVDFFPGESEVLVVALGDKVYAVEAEQNPSKKLQLLYSGTKPDFRIVNNIIYIKDLNFLGQLEI
jgi:hypothetical protein